MKTNIIVHSGWCSAEHDETMLAYALKVTGVQAPEVCFLNTASSSSPEYIAPTKNLIEKLNGIPSDLDLFGTVRKDISEFLATKHLILVGGGNTRSMLALWREYKIDKALEAAYNNGVVLTGFSAGAISWFEQGLTDAVEGDPQAIECLGLLPGSCCPHYDTEVRRKPTFLNKIKTGELKPGYALNDFTGIHFQNGKVYKVLTTDNNVSPLFIDEKGDEQSLSAEYMGQQHYSNKQTLIEPKNSI